MQDSLNCVVMNVGSNYDLGALLEDSLLYGPRTALKPPFSYFFIYNRSLGQFCGIGMAISVQVQER